MVNKDALIKKINKLKEEREAIILAHNYQVEDVQDIADYLGDSLDLSRKAAKTEAKVIVFCGVYFMAEIAAILSPKKKVLIPDREAGCPLADMVTAWQLRKKKEQYKDAIVVTYVNSPAEVKAESDYCCTSANAINLVKRLPSKRVLFIPDKYLGSYVASKVDKEIILWEGYCPVHKKISPEGIEEKKRKYPQAEVIVHPECVPEVISLAEGVFSTGGMCKYVRESKVKEIIVGTEVGMIHRLKRESPDKRFYPGSEEAVCLDMKKISLEKILWSLEEMSYQVKVKEDIAFRARRAIDRMLEVT